MTQPTIYKQYRRRYTQPGWLIDQTHLTFHLSRHTVKVTAHLTLRRNPDAPSAPCVLNGSAKLLSLAQNGQALSALDYRHTPTALILRQPPERFTLEIQTTLYPHRNTKLMGLYASGNHLFTQCEPEGFREITYYLDRPDVLSVFTTTIIANQHQYPVLLSNGNKIDAGELDNDQHWVTWHDPHRKPAYLFALVAGQLVATQDQFIQNNGKSVALEIWTEAADQQKVAHAMASLKQAMAWDEYYFGLSYDLDIYMIVAVKDFNMGAMENKGLNIFNTKYVLANPATATDKECIDVTKVIGHEYFHNWTGNRVTCRDWFQLSLKEGLTVFREQLFSETLAHAAIARIQDVRLLRQLQFAEDSGPTAHPVRPDSYLEINNFYTATVYEKGAEIIRMYQTLLGPELFKKGLALYLKRHDGQAATCDDFIAAMAETGAINLKQFARWYEQSGTPQVTITSHYQAQKQTYHLTIQQHTFPTPDQPKKRALHIPLAMGLIDQTGQALPLYCNQIAQQGKTTCVLPVTKTSQRFTFKQVRKEPTPSLLRNFSAPVTLHINWHPNQLAFLMMHDEDLFARWEAGQLLAKQLLVASYHHSPETETIQTVFQEAWSTILKNTTIAPDYKALLLTLPNLNEMLAWFEQANPVHIQRTHKMLFDQLAKNFSEDWWGLWTQTTEELSRPTKQAAGLRALRNLALAMLTSHPQNQKALEVAEKQFKQAETMSDQMGALSALNHSNTKERLACLAEFSQRYQYDALVMDKYFYLIASSQLPDTLAEVKKAYHHPAFVSKNPNKLFALLGSFSNNVPIFHAANGSSYRFFEKKINQIDRFNPQVASYLIKQFNCLTKLAPNYQKHITISLKKILRAPHLSNNVREIAEKMIAAVA